jgi:hypothetical protein
VVKKRQTDGLALFSPLVDTFFTLVVGLIMVILQRDKKVK